MYEKEFALRLSTLRTKMNVSAREMSLALGQNPGYINNIESGKTFPAMNNFFYICEYLKVTPSEFLNFDLNNPLEQHKLTEKMNRLTEYQLELLGNVADQMKES